MAYLNSTFLDKIANPDFALAALRGNEPHGEFKALVRFAQPGKQNPNIKILEICSERLLKIRIPCDQIEDFVEDGNVLRVELSEYVSNGGDSKAFED